MVAFSEQAQHLTVGELAARYAFKRDTIYLWIAKGVLVAGGTVKLRAVRVGGSWRVTPEAWEEFLAACNPGEPPSPVEDRKAAAASARRMRKRLGIGKPAKAGG